MRNIRVQSVSLVWEIPHDSSKARRARYHNTDFRKHFIKRDTEEKSCRPQYSLYLRGQFPRENCYMTMQFKYVSFIVLLPLIRLIIEFEWDINRRRWGMVSSRIVQEDARPPTTNYQCAGYGRKNSNYNCNVVLVCSHWGRLQMHFWITAFDI